MPLIPRPNILLIEAHPALRSMYCMDLAPTFNLFAIGDAETAHASIENLPRIDVLLTDFHFDDLQGRTGLVLARSFRRKFETAPMFLLSARPLSPAEQEVITGLSGTYVERPISLSKLKWAIDFELFQRNKTRQPV